MWQIEAKTHGRQIFGNVEIQGMLILVVEPGKVPETRDISGDLKEIPPGQPILVGHHSENRHRRDLDKIDRNMRKSVEADEKADYYAARAEAAASNTAISSDDPEAVEKLQAKLEGLQAEQAMMKAINAYYRKHKTLDGCPELTPEVRQGIEKSWSMGWYVGIPFPSYALSNNNAEINRTKKRLEALRIVDEMEHVEIEFDGGMASYVRHTSAHLPIILFSHRPLKFFFLILAKPPVRNILPVSPKALPKNEIRSFWGNWVPCFWEYTMTQPQCLQGFQAIAVFPNPQKGNITMSWGNVIYSV